jgi:hypothetical protein
VSQLQKNLPWSYALADCGATAMTRLRQHWDNLTLHQQLNALTSIRVLALPQLAWIRIFGETSIHEFWMTCGIVSSRLAWVLLRCVAQETVKLCCLPSTWLPELNHRNINYNTFFDDWNAQRVQVGLLPWAAVQPSRSNTRCWADCWVDMESPECIDLFQEVPKHMFRH